MQSDNECNTKAITTSFSPRKWALALLENTEGLEALLLHQEKDF